MQTWVVGKVAQNLSAKMQTKVSIKKVNFRFFNQLIAEGILIEDRQKDTLLYADAIKADVTDWFIFKDHIELKNIELKDAIVNMHRTDSIWNYQFFLDYFASPKSNKAKKDLNLNLHEVHFTNVHFNKVDKWVGQNQIASIRRLDLTTDSVNFNTGQVYINKVYLNSPSFWQSDYQGNDKTVTDLTQVLKKIPIVSAFQWNNTGFRLVIKEMEVENGTFMNEKYTERDRYTDRFDGQHVRFENINGSFKNVSFLNDTLTAKVQLKASEQSGLIVKNLSSNLKFTPVLMEFKDLDLRTNRSNLGDYLSMEYRSFNQDFSSFLHNVVLGIHFVPGSTLYSDDLAIFGPELKNWKRIFHLQGDAKGTVDNFSATNLKLKTGASYIDGRISMRGLPDIDNTFIDFTANNFETNYRELVSVIPALRKVTQPAVAKLGNIKYKGNFTGFISDFVSYGTLNTNLGTLVTDINMKIINSTNAAYSGRISTSGFQLGSFINNPDLGIIAVDAKIKGSGFNLSNINTTIDGVIQKVYFKGYTYQNLVLNGDFEKKLFQGHASINDPNLKISDLDGSLNLSTKNPYFTLNATAQKINFQPLGFTTQPVSLSGIFNLDFTGSNIDNFIGTAQISNAVLQNDSSVLSFDSLRLTSTLLGDKKRLTLQSNEIDGSITGDFSILDLPNAFKIFLSRYYPSYIKPPTRSIGKEDFTFDISTYNIEQYLQIFDNKLTGFNNSKISGKLKLSTNELEVAASVPQFGYAGKIFNNTNLTGNGNRDTLYSTITIDDIKINDSFHLPESTIKLTAYQDISDINLTTRGSKTLNNAELNASVQSFADGVKIKFFPSSFVINDKKWELEKDGELTLRKNFIDASEIKFVQGKQEIIIGTELDEINDKTHLVAQLKNIYLQDFAPFFLRTPSLEGIVTGTATVYDPYGNTSLFFKGTADSFKLDDSYVGKVNLEGDLSTITGDIKFKANAAEKDYTFNVDGSLNFKDTLNNKLNIDFKADRFNIKILQPFLETVFSQMDGIAQGNINIKDIQGKQYITGTPTISNGSMTIAYTQCKYLFDKQIIQFGEDFIDLGTMNIKDTLGNTGIVSGRMNHHFFKDFSFPGLRLQTDRMLLLNTTKADNSQFWGNVIGRATMTLSGAVTNLQMNIDGAPSLIDSSHIYLNTNGSTESNVVDYIEFIQFGSEMASAVKPSQESNITVNLDIDANPACKVDVILDEETQDVIKGQGNGRLSIRVGTKEPMRMSGRYVISKGEYTFKFQTFLDRPFTVTEGSSITWNGDPLQAQIDIKAEYLAKNVDLSSLSATAGSGLNSNAGQKTDITILSTLTGNLQSPVIHFEFKLPEYSDLNRDYIVVKRLADFQNDENQMLNQVASLILFNSFISSDQSFLSQQNTIALATNTIGGVISRLLTGLLNKELERATNGIVSTYIDINPSLDLKSTANQLQANIRGGLKFSLSNRLVFYAGGTYDYNNQLSILNRRSSLTPDFTLEWSLNKDGSIRVIAFNKTSVDLTNGQRNRTGVQLGYRRDVNKISDLFKSKKRLLEEEQRSIKN